MEMYVLSWDRHTNGAVLSRLMESQEEFEDTKG